MSPLGIALLGLRVGDRMAFRAGRYRPLSEVIVEDVGVGPAAYSSTELERTAVEG